MLVSVNIDW